MSILQAAFYLIIVALAAVAWSFQWINDRRSEPGVSAWYVVTFDDDEIQLEVRPPGGEPWTATVGWHEIERVCLQAEDFMMSDGLYLFTSRRPESYAVPTEASGGSELLFELARRGLFSYELIIEASGSIDGLYCWPQPNVEDQECSTAST